MTRKQIIDLLPYEVIVDQTSIHYASSIDWCKSQVQGLWTIALAQSALDNSVCFQSKSDALLYKLIWGGRL